MIFSTTAATFADSIEMKDSILTLEEFNQCSFADENGNVYFISREINEDSVYCRIESEDGLDVIESTSKGDVIVVTENETNNGPEKFEIQKDSLIDESEALILYENGSLKSGDWGAWKNYSTRVNTGGMKTAVVTGVIAAAAPWLDVKVIATVASIISAKYDYVLIKGKYRYKYDKDYTYYQRYTNIYGNGKDKLLKNDHYINRKQSNK